MNKVNYIMPMFLVAIGASLFSLNDLVFKHLTSIDIIWWEFLVFGVPVEIIIIIFFAGYIHNFNRRKIYKELLPKNFFYPLLRGLLAILSIALMFLSLKNLPLSITTILLQTAPLWMAFVAFFTQKERPDIPIILAIIFGMSGVLFIVNPSFEGINIYLIFPLLVGLLNALMNFIITKKSNDASPLSFAFWLFVSNGLIGLIIWTIVGVNFPNLNQMIWIIVAGSLGATAFIFVSYGYSLASGKFARVGVMSYIQLPVAIILGSIFYNEKLTLNSYIGSIIIICAGIFVILKDNLKAK